MGGKVLLVVALLLGMPTAALADSYWDVEAASANARASGPTNERDAELLERYGCFSGTRSTFCERQQQDLPYRAHRRAR